MSVQKVSNLEANAVAASVDFPDPIPSYGLNVYYNNKSYLLSIQNGLYVAYDLTVYAADGTPLKNSTDVYLNAAKEVVKESASDIYSYSKILLLIAAIVAVFYFLIVTGSIKNLKGAL